MSAVRATIVLVLVTMLGCAVSHEQDYRVCESTIRQFLECLSRDDYNAAAALISTQHLGNISARKGAENLAVHLKGVVITEIKHKEYKDGGYVWLYFNGKDAKGIARAFGVGFKGSGGSWGITNAKEVELIK